MGANESLTNRDVCPQCHSPRRPVRQVAEKPPRKYPEEGAIDEFSRLLKKRKSTHRQQKPPEKRVPSPKASDAAGWWTQSGFGEEGRRRALAYQAEVRKDYTAHRNKTPKRRKEPQGVGMLTLMFDEADKRKRWVQKNEENALRSHLGKTMEYVPPIEFQAVPEKKAVLQNVEREFFFDKYFFNRQMTPRYHDRGRHSPLPQYKDM